MLQSSRFTTVVTHETHERLLRAQDNSGPIARGDRHRGAIVAVQSALSTLNDGYLVGAEVDGFFGPRTARAIEAFQRDYGLVADAIVGRQVMTQLDSLFSGDVVRPPHGVSIHIGVDRVDPQHYGSAMTLPSCENDARAMERIASDIGYDTLVLANEEATTSSFAGFVRSCAANLFADDSLFITFSGHGSQVPNSSDDFEPDLLDETLCFYDRMLVDDEFYSLMATLREGVRVHVLFDSCHSGTAFKALLDNTDEVVKRYTDSVSKGLAATPYTSSTGVEGIDPTDLLPIKGSSIDQALEGERPEQVDPAAASKDQSKGVAELFGSLFANGSFGQSKFAEGTQVYERNRALYDTVKDVVGAKDESHLACTATSLSAAMDYQTTPAGNPLSLFTFNVTQAWNNGAFRGSYEQFLRALRDRSRQDATPQLNSYGSGGAVARQLERPFTF